MNHGRTLASRLMTSQRKFWAKRFHGRQKPTMTVTPSHALMDQTVAITATALEPKTPITLHAHLKEGKINFTSYAHYVTDEEGNCDVTKNESVGGMYTGVEPMGLFWSMESGPREPSGRALMKIDVEEPFLTTLSVFRGHITWEQCMDQFLAGRHLARTSCERTYVARGVTRIPVRHGTLRGSFFRPPGPGPFPAVIDLYGLIGGLVEFRAALLASRGIASLAVAYFDYEDLPPMIDRFDMAYFYQCIDLLRSQTWLIQDKGFGVLGLSMGGQVAGFMSAYFPEIKCCVIINSGVHYLLTPPYHNGWIGRSVLRSFDALVKGGTVKPNGLIQCNNWMEELMRLNNTDEYCIPLEKSKARFLILVGQDDEIAPPVASDHVVKRLQRGGNKDYELVRYPGAGHFIHPPHAPMNPVMQFAQAKLSAGGNKVEHARAQEQSWERIIQFIKETLKP